LYNDNGYDRFMRRETRETYTYTTLTNTTHPHRAILLKKPEDKLGKDSTQDAGALHVSGKCVLCCSTHNLITPLFENTRKTPYCSIATNGIQVLLHCGFRCKNYCPQREKHEKLFVGALSHLRLLPFSAITDHLWTSLLRNKICWVCRSRRSSP
jgi:hypothetical protein